MQSVSTVYSTSSKDLAKATRRLSARGAMTWSIASGHAMSAAVAGPAPSVTAVDGTIWVTQTGDSRDYILHPGDRIVLSGRGRVVIQAMDDLQTTVHTDGLA